MTVLTGARLVTAQGIRDDAWLGLAGGRITEIGSGPAPAGAQDLGGGWLVPGFIDLHMHGGGGHDVTTSAAQMAAAVAFHRSHGTTRTLVSLVAAPVAELITQLGWVADLAAGRTRHRGQVLGAHLEGPFLSQARCGAQNPAHLRTPDVSVFAELHAAARGCLRCVTVAPELPGALELIDAVSAADVVAAVGHTDATYAQAAAAFAAGATLTTHLGNAMRPLHQREPGPILAALDAAVACEVINDGTHVHPAVVRMVAARGAATLVLVTDAIAAAGMGDGAYALGAQPVRVEGGQARLVRNGALAGSTLTMDAAFRRAVLEVGLPIEVAVAAAATNPARVLGLADECGAIAPGYAADLVQLDAGLSVRRVMQAGEWVGP